MENKRCPINHLPLGESSDKRVRTFFPPNGTIALLRSGEFSYPKEGIEIASSFTPDQLQYVSIAIKYLALLCDGIIVGQYNNEDVLPMPLSQRIVGTFLRANRGQQLPALESDVDNNVVDSGKKGEITQREIFKNAITEGVYHVVSDFNKLYPNLKPVVDCLYLSANARSGTDQAIEKGEEFFIAAQMGEVTKDDQHTFRIEQREFSDFLTLETDMPEVEVVCVGKSFAQAVLRHAKKAALELVMV